jgi:sigma-B regulation protein RsbU (phosphoserine phosphatase)
LGLIQQGLLPLHDLLRIESDQLHRTYQLFTSSEQALAESKITLERKIIELQASNRVLENRTEELISLQEIGQTLIGTSTLRELARQVCRQASSLCGADRAIFYFLRDDNHADVLATRGWAPGRVPLSVKADTICDPSLGPAPVHYNQWPPGVKPQHADVEGARLRAGLRIPLIAQGTPVGAMVVHSTTKSKFKPGAVALLQTFANQSAIAIQRAGLIENLQEKITQLEAAQEGLAQKERIEHELDLAHEVQQAVLPQTFPQIQGYSFAAHNEPARQVGGDFYDVIDLGNNRFGLVVADVSDKGMPAAVYMALTRSLIFAEARRGNSPVMVLQNVNEMLRELGRARMFVTIFYGIVDGASHEMKYARAGHDRPFLVRGTNIQELKGEGVLLGFLGSEDLFLTEETVKLKPADRLILYTDGLTDTTSPNGTRFDRQGLQNLLRDFIDLPANELCGAIFAALLAFQDNAEQFDDMTLLVVEVNAPHPNTTDLEKSCNRDHQSQVKIEAITFSELNEPAAKEIVSWCYQHPYDIYNLEDSQETINYLTKQDNHFYAMHSQNHQLIGFCSFGKDGQVPGGSYEKQALDIGMGLHPDLTGKGQGHNYVASVLEFAQREFSPDCVRVTIAAFNLRSQRVWEKNGFQKSQSFTQSGNNLEFVVLEKTI